MAKEFAQAFYHSKRWKKCRSSYISKRVLIDGGMCEICKDSLGHILHHKISLTPANINNADISLNPCNLQYVCKACHDNLDGHGLNKKKEGKCLFDSNGQPIPKNF